MRVLFFLFFLLFAFPAFALQISDGWNNDIYNGHDYRVSNIKFEEIAAKDATVPVGTIISWPVGSDPEDMDNWLECDGKRIDPSKYPDLIKVVGTHTPDLQGLFLRGKGGNSNPLGDPQPDAIRRPNGTGGSAWWMSMRDHHHGGAFCGGSGISCSYWSHWRDGEDTQDGLYRVTLDMKRLTENSWNNVNVDDEFRPANVSVRYLIRAIE